MSRTKILGDFQTPITLTSQVVSFLEKKTRNWERVLEPTCGRGNFLQAVIESSLFVKEVVGIEIQSDYVRQARTIVSDTIRVLHDDIFSLHLGEDIQWQMNGDLLVIGNPPWVTNSAQGSFDSNNLPIKSNFKNFSGMDAMTGASNFDIAEFIIIKLLQELKSTRYSIAFLCKTSVARNILLYASQNLLPITNVQIIHIDAKSHFNAAVDAALLYLDFDIAKTPCYEADIFDSFITMLTHRIGIINGRLVSDIHTYHQFSFAFEPSRFEWRQGVKHDAAPIMELSRSLDGWQNQLSEKVDIEDEYIFPLMKSSDLYNQRSKKIERGIILTQKTVGQDTHYSETAAPRLWAYLSAHQDYFERRKSSIYRGKSPFSIFGIGAYSYSPYKLMISGLYKELRFTPISLYENKPVIADDTCYLLPFDNILDWVLVSAILTSN